MNTNTGCEVCGGFILWNKLCDKCIAQKEQVDNIRAQKKRDAAFGNPWVEAGVRND